MNTFEKYNFQEFCYQTINELGFNKPTSIQEKVIPLVYKNNDIIGISQTGTGKTHAFLLPVMDQIDTESRLCSSCNYCSYKRISNSNI